MTRRSKAKRVQRIYGPGCGCWLCSPWDRVRYWRARKEREAGYEIARRAVDRLFERYGDELMQLADDAPTKEDCR